jgi:ABC-type branched-subunit amino acid transport system substrate-binding protein
MKNSFNFIFLVLLLAGCVSSGFSNPYNKQYDMQAQKAPSQLVPHEAVYKTDNTQEQPQLDQAGLQYNGQQQTSMSAQQAPLTSETYPGQNMPLTAPQGYMPKVKVALLVPLSGEYAHLGEALLQASQLALFDLKYDNFELIPRDTKGTPEGAMQAAYSAVNSGAQFVMGPLFSASVRAAQPAINRAGINMMAFSTDWSLAGRNTFIMGFLPFAQVQRITQFAIDSGYENIGILAPNNDYGNAVIAAYTSYAYRTGLPTPDIMRFPVDGGDLSPIIRTFSKFDERALALEEHIAELEASLKLDPQNKQITEELKLLENAETFGEPPFDAILLPVGGDQARSIVNLLSLYDIDPDLVKRLGTGLWDDKGLASEPGLQGAWYAAPSPELRRRFEIDYKDTYGQEPPRISSLAYDATALAVVLARHANTASRPEEIFSRQRITNDNGFAGIDGIFRFRPDGLIERGLSVMEIRKNEVVILAPAPTTFQRPALSSSN